MLCESEKVVCIKKNMLNVNRIKTILWYKCHKFYALVKCHVIVEVRMLCCRLKVETI